MGIKSFEKLIFTESAARRELKRRRYKNRRVFCHVCHSRKMYRLSEGRYQGQRCRYAFGLLTGTWFRQSRVALATWLWLIKLFELEVTAHQAAFQTGVSYPTALHVFTIVRRAILAQEQPGRLGSA